MLVFVWLCPQISVTRAGECNIKSFKVLRDREKNVQILSRSREHTKKKPIENTWFSFFDAKIHIGNHTLFTIKITEYWNQMLMCVVHLFIYLFIVVRICKNSLYANWCAGLIITIIVVDVVIMSSSMIVEKARQRASVKWILSKAYNNRVPENQREPFYRDHEGQDHLKPQVCTTITSIYFHDQKRSHRICNCKQINK